MRPITKKEYAKLPKVKCQQCKKTFFVAQSNISFAFGIDPTPPQTCKEHE